AHATMLSPAFGAAGGVFAGVAAVAGVATLATSRVKARADHRFWSNLPDKVHVLTMPMPASREVQVEFLDASGAVINELTQTARIEVDAAGRGVLWARARRATDVDRPRGKRRMNRLSLTLALAASLVLTGCSGIDKNEGPRPGVRISDDRAPNQRLNLDTVVILDKSLQDRKSGKLAIENSGARRTAAGTVEAYAVIRNRTDFPLQIEGRTQFFDSLGLPLGA